MTEMSLSNPLVDKYLLDGCMRCKYGATPQCKVHSWHDELVLLRALIQSTGLTEEIKWGSPVYTFNGKNILSLGVLKDCCVLGFFKGALLSDPHQILEQQGNIQAARIIRFTDTAKIQRLEKSILEYIGEAIGLEAQGLKVQTVKNPEPMPEELISTLEADPELKAAFFALTLGRQRGYIIHFSQPKQAQTRYSRIAKHRERILQGLGFHD
jgi:uncharacterized protein YdeI (YjbR/CyaY-like superfamily)